MFKTFRAVAFLEGVSYILLLIIGMPLKYWGGNDVLIKLLGMPHGVLFVAYVILAILLMKPQKWSVITLGVVLVASLLPFGTFYIDKKYLQKK
jgi:integral membrane protein